jgi:hypothetical protein
LLNDPAAIDAVLDQGAAAANAVIGDVTARARTAAGL